MIQTVSYIQTQSVDIECLNPETDAAQKILHHLWILQIQFHQLEMTFPAFVPETVIVGTVSFKTDMEPVFIRRIPFFFLNIPKSPETTANMVKYSVQDDFDTVCMQILTDFPEIIVCAETAVNLCEIPGIVTMVVGFENRIQDDGPSF